MKVIFLGDVVGRSGRDAVKRHLPEVRRTLKADFVIANGENAAAGFGITKDTATDLHNAGVDVITTGNHVWDQRDAIGYIAQDTRLLRPRNFPPGAPGRGAGAYQTQGGARIVVINLMGRVFMDALDDPFQSVEAEMARLSLGGSAQAIVVDMHAEATSEKMAMGHFLDGRVSLVVGTHSHVPTADAQILPGGTAYQTDAGMCGDYDSVIGMQKAEPINRFTRKIPGGRWEAANGEGTMCGLLLETDDRTGLARRIEPIRLGGRLSQAVPQAVPAA
ncbi:TIGR00282 family metallophosphoesterase [Zavarzinia sp. CC-PAN008]|uniref:TIGR00282 family metallophosphoesterase n=1 Tax=Zavarzinia sp. CC-PAN008 TaxID=3243332 RepID=UPI003F74929F